MEEGSASMTRLHVCEESCVLRVVGRREAIKVLLVVSMSRVTDGLRSQRQSLVELGVAQEPSCTVVERLGECVMRQDRQ